MPTAASAVVYAASMLVSLATPLADFLIHAQLLVLGLQMHAVASTEGRRPLLDSIRGTGAGWLAISYIVVGGYLLSLLCHLAGVGDGYAAGQALRDPWIRAAIVVIESSVGWLIIPFLYFLLPLVLLAGADIGRAWALSSKAVNLNLRPLCMVAAVSFVAEQAVLITAVCSWPPILLVIALAIQPFVAAFMFAAYRDVFLNLPPAAHARRAHHQVLATEGAP
ncbi:hypothetical protein [Rhodanobacter sp. FW106-PBR-LB-2-11]|uniref:hypothetical protein n=1 Tax=Rhodanobacter sp. FW106-PBR-LB-2-11 TaxID=1524463 RepID=UPI0034E53422